MNGVEQVTVPRAVRGYPGVAFGGYVAGLLAGRAVGRTVRVDFRLPTPVEVPVELAGDGDGGAVLTGGDGVLATATAGELDLDVPEPPSWDEASAAAEAYRADPPEGTVDCFGCGLDRTPDTGLRQHCGIIPGRDLVATAWSAGPALADAEGRLRPEMVWGALDCPGNAAGRMLGTQREGSVTASLTARVLRPVPASSPLLSYAWVLDETGRKHRLGVALAAPDGDLYALASALWLDPRRP
ncbi:MULTISPECIES: hypothetical protein [unclassified Streptomyces]|uniref:hypothetical protein n=1 Tax=unclassified Streptomyces TaxID=2593676 RepID=UPI00278C7829|nr:MULTISPECIES: hypothetical protein [unclassified Streptomyces]